MSVSYLFDPVKQFVSRDGNILEGGFLNVFVGESQEPADTFSDAAGTLMNPKNIPIDSDGRAPGVFVDDTKIYTLKAYTTGGQLQFSIYPVKPVKDGTTPPVVPLVAGENVTITELNNTIVISATGGSAAEYVDIRPLRIDDVPPMTFDEALAAVNSGNSVRIMIDAMHKYVVSEVFKKYDDSDTETITQLWFTFVGLNGSVSRWICDADDNPQWSSSTLGDPIKEAPNDGKTYGRKNKEWVEVVGGGGSAMTRFAHWCNEDGWKLPTINPYTYPHDSTTLAEGDLTASARPHAPAGVYHFDAEVSFYVESQTDDFVKYDAAIKYGTQTLRAVSLVNDNSWPENTIDCVQNHHFSGVFKLDSEGDIDLVLTKCDGGPHMRVKFSHLFLYKIGDI